jgi:hypothetical protein
MYEFERQTREARQHAEQDAPGPSANLRGPVGLRGRTANVANYTDDQSTIISLLFQIPQSDGGKGGVWVAEPLAGPNGQISKMVAEAIWEFQDFWLKKGVFHHIDGVVDPGGNTLKQMLKLSKGRRGHLMPENDPRKYRLPNLYFLSMYICPTQWDLLSFNSRLGMMDLKDRFGTVPSLPIAIYNRSIGAEGFIPIEGELPNVPYLGSAVHRGPRAQSDWLSLRDLMGPGLLIRVHTSGIINQLVLFNVSAVDDTIWSLVRLPLPYLTGLPGAVQSTIGNCIAYAAATEPDTDVRPGMSFVPVTFESILNPA